MLRGCRKQGWWIDIVRREEGKADSVAREESTCWLPRLAAAYILSLPRIEARDQRFMVHRYVRAKREGWENANGLKR